MKKKNYMKPSFTVVELEGTQHLMAASNGVTYDGKGANYEEAETDDPWESAAAKEFNLWDAEED